MVSRDMLFRERTSIIDIDLLTQKQVIVVNEATVRDIVLRNHLHRKLLIKENCY